MFSFLSSRWAKKITVTVKLPSFHFISLCNELTIKSLETSQSQPSLLSQTKINLRSDISPFLPFLGLFSRDLVSSEIGNYFETQHGKSAGYDLALNFPCQCWPNKQNAATDSKGRFQDEKLPLWELQNNIPRRMHERESLSQTAAIPLFTLQSKRCFTSLKQRRKTRRVNYERN